MKLIALCAFRDAEHLLPEFLDHLVGHVDGALLVDDASKTDAGYNICQAHPLVMNLGRGKPMDHAPHAYESECRNMLLRVAQTEGASHVLCLDCDERLELGCLRGLRSWIAEMPNHALEVQLRDLWNGLDQYRTDPPWDSKRKVVLFPLKPFDKYYPANSLHQPWMPPGQDTPIWPTTFNLYHLGSQTPELRRARVAKFNAIDARKAWQADYDYIASENGLTVEKIPDGRNYR